MSEQLLLITVGPVQEFIAQARRTRDLWYGSHLLSELSRVAARAVAEAGGELIYPSLKRGDRELEPCNEPLRNGHPPLSIANKIMAVVPGDPEKAARAAREAVVARLADVAQGVRGSCHGLLAPDIDSVWGEQIATLPEFYAAWAPVDGDYAAARRRVEEAVAGRKSLREFGPWRCSREGAPKSSLDGARETVLAEPDQRDRKLVARYRLGDGEQLDAVSLLKRAGGNPEQFVPLATVALAPWLARARRAMGRELDDLQEACLKAGFSRVNRPDLPCAQPFRADAQVFFPGRWSRLFEELGSGPRDSQGRHARARSARDWGETHVRPLLRRLGEPSPYVACLVADGDRMGEALSSLSKPDQHRAFSARLAEFPAAARGIVEQEHRGALVYSGGDDVLAFLPVSEAVAAAEALCRVFGELMREACPAAPPTLSVGIGIGHLLEGMSDLLEFGRAAERLAKRERNSLAILLDKRSGGQQTWAAPWPANPARRLVDDQALLGGRLSVKKVYELGALLRRLPQRDAGESDTAWLTRLQGELGPLLGAGRNGSIDRATAEAACLRVLRLEVRRILGRVRAGGEQKVTPEEVGLILGDSYPGAMAALRDWVHRLRVAIMIAAAKGDDHE